MNVLIFLAAGVYAYTFGVRDMIHVANVLYLASYSVRDILWLRILTVVAALCLIPYYFGCGAEPLWDAITWNLLFTVVNLFQIFLLVKERWPVSLGGLEREVYDKVFQGLMPGEFVKLLKLGSWTAPAAGTILVEDGQVVHDMMLLCVGEAVVRVGDREVARLRPGQFVGEMSFLTQEKASASVVAEEGAKLLTWPQKELQAFLDKRGDMAFKVRGILGRDLVKKLQKDTRPVLD